MGRIEDLYSRVFNAVSSRDKVLEEEVRKELYRSGRLAEKLDGMGKSIGDVEDLRICARPDSGLNCDYEVEMRFNSDQEGICLFYCTRRASFVEKLCSNQ